MTAGQIAGIMQEADFSPHAVVWTGGTIQDTGSTLSYDRNNAGRVAGYDFLFGAGHLAAVARPSC
jgi:hypothetical protein